MRMCVFTGVHMAVSFLHCFCPSSNLPAFGCAPSLMPEALSEKSVRRSVVIQHAVQLSAV